MAAFVGGECCDRWLQQVEGGAQDAVGVNAVVAVDVVEGAGLAESGDAECGVADAVDSGKECEGMRVAVEDCEERGGAVGGEELIEDPGFAGVEGAAGLERPEQQAGAGDAEDVGGNARLREAFGGGEGFGHHRAHCRDGHLRVVVADQWVSTCDDLSAAAFAGRGIRGDRCQLLVDGAGRQA